jgi:glycosyltransferase involved in cell wall biosynthesis
MKVSTVIPAYNAERTIAQALDSALAQNYPDHEIIVVNDGSTDCTATILRQYRDRIRIVDQPNRGAAAARNIAVAHAKGKYIALLDSDDLWLPRKLNTMVAALEQNPGASLAFSEYTAFGEGGVEYRHSSTGHAPSMQELLEGLPDICTSTWVVNRNIFENAGGFCETFKGCIGYEDGWMLCLLRELGEFVYVPNRFTLYRMHENEELGDKYAPGLRLFTALAKSRYGAKSYALIRNQRNHHCRYLLSKLAHQMDRGERLAALFTLARIARLRPVYFLGPEFLGRLRLPHNAKRVLQLITSAGRREV